MVIQVAKWLFTLLIWKRGLMLSSRLNTHTHTQMITFPTQPTCSHGPMLTTPQSALVDWLSASLLNWVVIQLKSSASALSGCGVKQIALCMHEYITSAAVIILGKAKAFGTYALLPTCTCCHCRDNKVSRGVCCEGGCNASSTTHVSHRSSGRETCVIKHSQNWKWLCTALKLSLYEYSSEPQTLLQLQ